MTALMEGPPNSEFYLTSRGRYLGLAEAIDTITTILDETDRVEKES